SDTGRKSWTTEAKEELTPESQKSYLDKAKEGVTDTADKLAGGLQTDDSKSAGQATFDKLRREKDSA
ncbi:heat shock protein 9/12, partial [Saitoella complicata NRRL Y-17804]